MNREIVINAGGSSYFTNAYVCLRMLRHLGCLLPVQFWVKDESEFHPRMPDAVKGLNVTFQDASHFKRGRGGWEQKVFSVVHCLFNQVMLLDADIVPVVDPTFLFEELERAIFWPDFHYPPADSPIWDICGIPPDSDPGFQGGQLIIDKVLCRKALDAVMEMTENSDIYYKHTFGEQDLWRMAFKLTKTPYRIIPHEPVSLEDTIIEHDFNGARLFQHRCGAKWTLGKNKHIPGFWHEDLCLKFLEELKTFFPSWVC